MQGVVKSIRAEELTLSSGENLAYGLCVWSTGVGPTDFTTSLPFAKSAKGRIAVDDTLRVLVHPDRCTEASGPTTPADVRTPCTGLCGHERALHPFAHARPLPFIEV